MRDTIVLAVCIFLVVVLVIAVIKVSNSNSDTYSEDDKKLNQVLNGLNYECNLICEDWPDAVFAIEFNTIPAKGIKEKIHSSLVDFINNYNQQAEKSSGGVIHYISEPGDFEDAPDNLTLHIDFGSADPIVIADVLNIFNQKEFCIGSITVE